MQSEIGFSNKVTRAVIPVAGFGSRMLPATKAIPKEMLPIVDKPVIQYIVEECANAGINEIILITHTSKKAIENHFCAAEELEASLSGKGKKDLLESVQNTLPEGVTLSYVQQGEAKGLGHAVLCGREMIGNEPFVVILPDVLIDEYHRSEDIDNLRSMVDKYEATGISQIMVEWVATEDISKFGIVDIAGVKLAAGESSVLKRVVEKPSVEDAPSNLAIVGRYVFSPTIWDLLETTTPGVGGEIQLTDAMDELINTETMDAYYMTGESHDCGNKAGYLKAILAYASRHPETKDCF
ncbi:MAG: UTP--glucose-1-phosphate uridylyltransferase GalU [Gammaproteobacteria bacterium]|nr:UTP--glucose-1-phosphate uridylyltransferase GalU [Gammaproteobacteria bacterium]